VPGLVRVDVDRLEQEKVPETDMSPKILESKDRLDSRSKRKIIYLNNGNYLMEKSDNYS
jgi:hypothetical protein